MSKAARVSILLIIIVFIGGVKSQLLLSKNQDIQLLDIKLALTNIQKHISFFAGIFNGDTKDISLWLSGLRNDSEWKDISSQLRQKNLVRDNLGDHLKAFPLDLIHDKVQSHIIKKHLTILCETGSSTILNDCVQALHDFVDGNGYSTLFDTVCSDDLKAIHSKESQNLLVQNLPVKEKLECAYVILKDATNVTFLLYAYFIHLCNRQWSTWKKNTQSICKINLIPDQNNILMNFLYIYNTINKLPLESAIKAIDTFAKEFAQMLKKLTIEDEGENEASGEVSNGVSNDESKEEKAKIIDWLRKKWVVIPIAMGVIIIKTIYYFWVSERESNNNLTPFFPFNEHAHEEPIGFNFSHRGM